MVCVSPAVVEEPREPVDPAVRAKENWLRLYNKVLDQLREVGPPVCQELMSAQSVKDGPGQGTWSKVSASFLVCFLTGHQRAHPVCFTFHN